MKLIRAAILVLAVTARVVTGWQVPRDTPPGIYAVAVDNGTEIGDAVLVASLSDLKPFTTPPQATRPSPNNRPQLSQDIWILPACFDFAGKEDMDHDSLNRANAQLDQFCGEMPGSYVHPGMNYYTISDCVVSYFCHFANRPISGSTQDVNCNSYDRRATTGWIDKGCGPWKPGQVNLWSPAGPDEYHVAYGRENYCSDSGHNFCGTGV
ncbi:hypothetical protein GE09DRAFT_1048424 [Coniochaeta sp. 2T2.1]|nr:hypothetical protein GE09DRAFT_1048424 [Coniochaeta sp. 2T2.1]